MTEIWPGMRRLRGLQLVQLRRRGDRRRQGPRVRPRRRETMRPRRRGGEGTNNQNKTSHNPPHFQQHLNIFMDGGNFSVAGMLLPFGGNVTSVGSLFLKLCLSSTYEFAEFAFFPPRILCCLAGCSLSSFPATARPKRSPV